MTVDDIVSNPTDNPPFEEVLRARVSRRNALGMGAAGAAVGFFFGGAATSFAENSGTDLGPVQIGSDCEPLTPAGPIIGFAAVTPADAVGPVPAISPDYEYQVLAPWGTPIQPDGPAWSWPPASAEVQEQQVGIGHDGMWFFAIGDDKGMLCINHEFGRTSHVLGKDAPETLEEVRIMQAAHGVSVIRIERVDGVWMPVASDMSRRITANTPVTLKGPARYSSLLRTKAGNRPAGTLNNCANGYTPWGTYLTCEENFNGYFGATDEAWEPTPEQDRYGFTADGFGYAWHQFDPRFDLSDPEYTNEENRFGWVVEINPWDAGRPPIKRTALGRFKHEGVALTIGQEGRAVAYMGDDERFDYIYKFVSADDHQRMISQGRSPLDEGQLYVARFNEDGSGDWLELTMDNPDLAAAFDSQAAILTYARMAADIVGATPMDRPEWTAVAPNGDVLCTLTNNSRREETNAANPLAPNPDGHIIRWTDADDHVGTTFTWDILIFSQDTFGTDNAFGSPDGLWVDPDGRIFIQTDGGQPGDINNQMLVASPDASTVKRLFAGVTGDEITGITVTQDRRTMFINMQHPGNGDPTATNFPAETDGVTVPRDCTIVLRRKDGGIVGS